MHSTMVSGSEVLVDQFTFTIPGHAIIFSHLERECLPGGMG